jgi:hypothetical protein
MWADHWLYFSGPKQGETKAELKRVALLAAIPFTLFYFGACIAALPRAWSRWRRSLPFDAPSTAALLFLCAFALLLIFVYREPEVGKNSTVKFCYLLGYAWLPLFPMLDRARDYPHAVPVLLGYTALLAVICLPLYVFTT